MSSAAQVASASDWRADVMGEMIVLMDQMKPVDVKSTALGARSSNVLITIVFNIKLAIQDVTGYLSVLIGQMRGLVQVLLHLDHIHLHFKTICPNMHTFHKIVNNIPF